MSQQDKLEVWLATQAFAWPTPLQIWEASRAVALEEAAQACDELRQLALEDMALENDERFGVYAKKYRNAALRIRALAKENPC